MNRAELASIAAKIARAVIDNGRVEPGSEHSLWVEVEYEARERDYANSAEIADEAVLQFGSMV